MITVASPSYSSFSSTPTQPLPIPDAEGIASMHTLGENMAHLLKSLHPSAPPVAAVSSTPSTKHPKTRVDIEDSVH